MVPSREVSETTQYYVMWCGVPQPDRKRRMWQALRDDFEPAPLKGMAPIRGLARAGLYTILERLEVAAELGDYAALVRDAEAMFLPMADSAPGTLWEEPRAIYALCHAIGCGAGGILTEEVLGIRTGLPLRIAPHGGGTLRWCKGHVTTPKGRVDVAWDWQKDRYQLRVSIPDGTTAEVVLPTEARTIWQSAPANKENPWRETIVIRNHTLIVVEPGRLSGVEPKTAVQTLGLAPK